ncbi:MAG: CoA-binding protein [Bilophila wadsworthia]
MGILINKNTKVVVQGITGREGSVRTKYMKSYGTHVVGGTSPGKKGSDVHGVPVYNTVKEIAREHGEIDFSVIFVPGHVLKTAVMEAADAGVKNVILRGRHSIHDIMEMTATARPGTACSGRLHRSSRREKPWSAGSWQWRANTFFKEGPSACSRAARPVGNHPGAPRRRLRREHGHPYRHGTVLGTRWRICFRCSRKIETEGVAVYAEIGGSQEEDAPRSSPPGNSPSLSWCTFPAHGPPKASASPMHPISWSAVAVRPRAKWTRSRKPGGTSP